MNKNDAPEMMDVGAENVDKTGFFCFMSKKKSEGYQRTLAWLKDRFAEGMRIKMLALPERGFIEYIPGEHAWRAVHADGYLFIHCLWVVGKSKGKGFSAALLDACVADAKRLKLKGVAMVTSEKVWMSGRRVLDKHGFECVDTAPPAFSLMVKKLGKHSSPSFAGEWDDKAKSFGKGLTVIRSDQCPYIVDAANTAVAAAAKAGISSQIIELNSRDDVMRLSPSPYGVFGLVLDGRLLSYHYLLEKDLLPILVPAPRDKARTSGKDG
ncbi:MAG: GNAT family N-acetyltransferase [Myxococcota bacterium]|jgi:GNAT superfamily N-acetyltransferase|nr:GNAT family N-acetyltransferase [Myxococcota bacterium]